MLLYSWNYRSQTREKQKAQVEKTWPTHSKVGKDTGQIQEAQQARQREYKDSSTGTFRSASPPKTAQKARTPREMRDLRYKNSYPDVRQAPREENTTARRQSNGTFAVWKGEKSEVELHLQRNVLLKTKMSTFFHVNKNQKSLSASHRQR